MLVTTFAAGEISRKLFGRVDLALYQMGAGKIENFEIVGTGGITRRPGTQRMGALEGPARIIPFVINSSTSFLFEIGVGYIRIWKDGVRLEVAGTPVQFTSTEELPLYASLAEAREIHYAQTYKEIYLVHKSYPPYKIAWNGGSSFTLDRLNFTGNVDEVPFQGSGNYPGTIAFFNGRLFLGGTLAEPQKVWASQPFEYENFIQYETVSTETSKIKDPDLRVFTATAVSGDSVLTDLSQDFTSLAADILTEQDVHAITATGTKGSSTLHVDTGSLEDIVNPTKYFVSGPGVAIGTKVKTIDEDGTITIDTQLAVASTAEAFTVQLCEVVHALTDYYVTGDGIQVGTKVLSVTATTLTLSAPALADELDKVYSIQLWRSASAASADDYETIYTANDVTGEGSAFFFEIASDKNDAIKWMCASSDLVIGTESAEWVVPSGVTAISIGAVLNTRHGSESLQAMVVGPSIMFFQQGARALREYFYSSDASRYQSTNLALWAPQVLEESPAIDYDYTNSPSPRILITRADGIVAALLYEKEQQVQGWYRIKLASGTIKSTATTPDASGTDTIWFAVKDGDDWYLERLNDSGSIFLDGYQSVEFSMPGVLLIDGTYGTSAIILNATTGESYSISSIPMDYYPEGDDVYIGYSYESLIESLPVLKDYSNDEKRITYLSLRLLDSDSPFVSVDDKPAEHKILEAPFSGVIKVPVTSSWERDVIYKIRSASPRAVTVLAINADVK